jgi:hypothetical protein
MDGKAIACPSIQLVVDHMNTAQPAGEADGCYRSSFSAGAGAKAPPQLTRTLEAIKKEIQDE